MPQPQTMSHDGQALCHLGPAEALPAQQPALEQGPDGFKRRAACDECRKRKLRCSGEPTGCFRCDNYQVPCHYSVQKPMGRPRKRQRQQEEELEQLRDEDWTAPDNKDPSSSFDRQAVSNYPDTSPPDVTDLLLNESIHPHIYSSFIQSRSTSSQLPKDMPTNQTQDARDIWSNEYLNGVNLDDTPPSEVLRTPPTSSNVPETWTGNASDVTNQNPSTKWLPDYKNFNMPAIVDNTSFDSPDVTSSLAPSSQTCACLSNLYLTLSSLSTLQSTNRAPGRLAITTPCVFPLVTPATIDTLRMASREAYRVIHCPICPRGFQTGMQNIMLLCTLLSVLGDIWGRLYRAPIEDIEKGFRPGTANADSMSDADWRALIRRLVRKGVYGRSETSSSGHHAEVEDEQCNRSYSIAYLINCLERRQKTWHGQVEDDGEFPGVVRHSTNTEDPKVQFGSDLSSNFGTGTRPYTHSTRAQADNVIEDAGGCKNPMMLKDTKEGHLCLQIVNQLRGIMAALNLEEEVGRS